MKKRGSKTAVWIGAFLVFTTMISCGSREEDKEVYRDDVACSDIVAAVAEALGDAYWPDTDMPPEYLEDMLGMSADLYVDGAGQTPMISTNVDTLIVVKAKPEERDRVTRLVREYQEALQQDTMQYPVNLGKIQASEVEVLGNYVCFIQLGADTSTLEEEEDVIEQCKAANEKAAEVIRQKLK